MFRMASRIKAEAEPAKKTGVIGTGFQTQIFPVIQGDYIVQAVFSVGQDGFRFFAAFINDQNGGDGAGTGIKTVV